MEKQEHEASNQSPILEAGLKITTGSWAWSCCAPILWNSPPPQPSLVKDTAAYHADESGHWQSFLIGISGV